MSNSYTLIIRSIDCLPTYQDQTEVVYNLNWTLSATDGVNTVEHQGTQSIEFNANVEFTPYNSLTREQVSGWLTSAEPFASHVSKFKEDLDTALVIAANPLVETIPPWVS